jgi:hypothetical protein
MKRERVSLGVFITDPLPRYGGFAIDVLFA